PAHAPGTLPLPRLRRPRPPPAPTPASDGHAVRPSCLTASHELKAIRNGRTSIPLAAASTRTVRSTAPLQHVQGDRPREGRGRTSWRGEGANVVVDDRGGGLGVGMRADPGHDTPRRPPCGEIPSLAAWPGSAEGSAGATLRRSAFLPASC